MASVAADAGGHDDHWHSHAGIPIRSLWTLLMYASDLAEFLGRFDGEIDDSADLPELLARLLVVVVSRRLRRNLSKSYQRQEKLVTRVRGRIDWLETESKQYLRQGRLVCSFEDQTFDTPRNRLVWAALTAMAAAVSSSSVAHDCRALAGDLRRYGVSPVRPSRAEFAREQIGRHDADDRLMITVARLALELIMPSEQGGTNQTLGLLKDEVLLREIFEKAVAGFYKFELEGRDGWKIRSSKELLWAPQKASKDGARFLPAMYADIVLTRGLDRRIVLDTKFANILTPRLHGGESFKSANIYQLFAYLRSQTGRGDDLADRSEGLLLYPAVNRKIDEYVYIQGHGIRFATVDLADSPAGIKDQLLDVIRPI